MQERTHVDLALTVLEALKWTGDPNLAAKNASFPDEVRLIEVSGLGFSFLGHGFQSLEHFGMPGVKDPQGRFVLNGYCYKRDCSFPPLDLPNRDITVYPEAWGEPILQTGLVEQEPTYSLTKVPGYKPIADEMTFAAASAMVEWTSTAYHKIRQAKLQASLADMVTGWSLHFVQDLSVPHHADLLMLDGHSAFEGDVTECWTCMKGSGEVAKLLDTFIKANNAPDGLTLRALAEDTATKAYVSPRRLCWSRSIYRHGWNKLVRQCVIRGLLASVQAVKVLQKAA